MFVGMILTIGNRQTIYSQTLLLRTSLLQIANGTQIKSEHFRLVRIEVFLPEIQVLHEFDEKIKS